MSVDIAPEDKNTTSAGTEEVQSSDQGSNQLVTNSSDSSIGMPDKIELSDPDGVEPHEPAQNDEGEQVELETVPEDAEQGFPVVALAKLDDMISKPRWVVPVLPGGELEILLKASIDYAKRGLDMSCASCQAFYKEGLTISFTKILTDEAVNGWKHEIQKCILDNCKLLIDLCVLKIAEDCLVITELLAVVLNPTSKFHMYNGSRPSEQGNLEEEDRYARSQAPTRGWLVDLINRFGKKEGFKFLLERFTKGPANGHPLTFPVISSLIRPFGQCYEYITPQTVKSYFLPIVDMVTDFLERLSDEEMKKESKNEAKNDALSAVMKGLKCLVAHVAGQEERIKHLELVRLKLILRLLKISSFNGKMNALNEVNKVIMNMTHHYQRHGPGSPEDEEWLTADKMALWIQDNEVLDIVLSDCLHQPQYVEKLEKILRFMIKERSLSLKDLDRIWDAQHGKHDAIVKNIHELLAKLAWDFSPEQLDHLFKCFQDSWHHANKKQREKLLELIRRLAEDDKDGIMASKVLGLLWSLAHSDDCPTDIMDQALAALIKILDYSCSQDRDQHKMKWIYKFVDELKNNEKWVLPALKQISQICQLFSEAPASYGTAQHSSRMSHIFYRSNVISKLQDEHSIVMTITKNLVSYMENARRFCLANPTVIPEEYLPDGRFSHQQQVSDRLRFMRFLLKDGQLWLCAPQAEQIWRCLAINAVYVSDREACFKWFTKLMGEEPDLDPEITKEFFEGQILKLDPSLLTESGLCCFDRFFRHVNTKDGRLLERRKGLVMDALDLVGMDYLWRVVLHGSDPVANKAVALMKELHANLGPRLQQQQMSIHSDFLADCFHRLRASFDTLQCLTKESVEMRTAEATRMVRVLTVVHEYISECDNTYAEERTILPLSRASRGKHMCLIIRNLTQNGRQEDFEIISHSNDTIANIRRQILQKIKALNNQRKVELYINGELVDSLNDRKLISHLGIKDKTVLTAKILQGTSAVNSGSESSSEGSRAPSPSLAVNECSSQSLERCLPGVIFAADDMYVPFLLRVSDHACSSKPVLGPLKEAVWSLLHLSPAHKHTMQELRALCELRSQNNSSVGERLESRFFSSASTSNTPSSAKAVYTLEVLNALLMPSNVIAEDTVFFQRIFVESGGMSLVLKALTQNDFMLGADSTSRRDALLLILRIAKLMLLTTSHAIVVCVAERLHRNEQVSTAEHQLALAIQSDLLSAGPNVCDPVLKQIAAQLAKQLMSRATSDLPDEETVRAVQMAAWASASGGSDLMSSSTEKMQAAVENMDELGEEETPAVQLTCTALEVLTLCLSLHPKACDLLPKDKAWQSFIVDMLLICKSRVVRTAAQDQFLQLAGKPNRSTTVHFCITLLFTIETSKVPTYARQSHQYFTLLCRLLTCPQDNQQPTVNENRLINEINWLKQTRKRVVETGESDIEEALLEGHLGIARELVLPMAPSKKLTFVSAVDGKNIIEELIEDFIFPASRVLLERRSGHIADVTHDPATPVCQTPAAVNAAYDLIVALCTGCVQNLKLVAHSLTSMFYQGDDADLSEWEYLPPVGSRPQHGFVGLKNGGATCYMNSVLQQLFMMPEIREGILCIEGAANDLEEFETQIELKSSSPPPYTAHPEEKPDVIERQPLESSDIAPTNEDSKSYHLGVLKQVQIIFAHLAYSKLQFYTPKGFWKQFRIQGERVNLREQHDALEFFERLVESCDEAMKSLGVEPLCSKVLIGSFADQKICKGCPHRYSQEQSFTSLNLEIKNHQHLRESLEQFVKGDLLEGANAYLCEKCGKKVDTVKRLCIRKLPKMLTIQLKRFDYDWERDCPIKFNDYFEFPREIDMEPYTVYGLAKLEGETWIEEEEKVFADQSTKYRLSGIVVHSGQASGGHYYSYIQHRVSQNSQPRWYKYDDGEVSECRMDDDEELKKECFGGEYTGEVFDHMLKRMSFRRQKRWWNAYMLMYERVGSEESSVLSSFSHLSLSEKLMKIPVTIERVVRRQNLEFMHNRNQFCVEYFQFMKKLLNCNVGYVMQHQQNHPGQQLPIDVEELSSISVQLVSRFLFSVAFHTKKALRGAAGDWYEALSCHIRASQRIRQWFADHVLFSHPHRFSEYLLECPSTEVRSTFAKILAFLAHCSRHDGPCPPPKNLNLYEESFPPENASLSDHLLVAVLALLRREISDHSRHIAQYFHLFVMYANLGPDERAQLLHLNVPATFMQVALEEGPVPAMKCQFSEITKLYNVVSLLIRCCDTSAECAAQDKQTLSQNPFMLGETPLMPIQPQVAKMLYKSKAFVKKIIEDNINTDETRLLMLFLCWENLTFSNDVLIELLWQIAYCYTYEMRPYLDLLQSVLMLEDSWQTHRIHSALMSLPEEKDGLYDIINRNKNHYQKRAYQCIKMLVSLFSRCEFAYKLMLSSRVLADRWSESVNWFNQEMEKRYAGGNNQYAYNDWSPPAQSNETSNGYFLERSPSAQSTLAKALELCPEEFHEAADVSEVAVESLDDTQVETAENHSSIGF